MNKMLIFISIIKRTFKTKFFNDLSNEFNFYSNLKNYIIHSSIILRLLITQKNKNLIISKFFYQILKYKTRDKQIFFLTLGSFLPKKFAWELYQEEMKFKLSKNSVVVDVGANLGFFSCRGAFLNNVSKWYLIECDPNNLKILNMNVDSLKVNNIFISNKALSNKDGVLDFMIGNDEGIGSIVSSNFFVQESKKVIKVPTITIKNFLIENKIDQIDLLKVDIEGSEYMVFENNLDIFNKVKSFIFELHMCNEVLPKNTKLYKYLKKNFKTTERYRSKLYGNKIMEIFGIR